jgi:hypothetical protein
MKVWIAGSDLYSCTLELEGSRSGEARTRVASENKGITRGESSPIGQFVLGHG